MFNDQSPFTVRCEVKKLNELLKPEYDGMWDAVIS